jgi:glycosyltransferase involved in cell wall biosynthesis
MHVEDAVEWAGPFPWKQLMAELIPQSTVAVYMADPKVPQFRNEIPNRLFEYWANSLPVIVSNGTLCGELVKRVNGGLTVNYGNTAELAAALEKLLKDADLRNELGANGRRSVLQDHNWVKEGSKLIDLYDDVLAARFQGTRASRWTSSKTQGRNRQHRQGTEEHGEAGYVGVGGE